ncbi:MAG: TIGR01244 family sulfur transferase [Pseudomonadota bacterium]
MDIRQITPDFAAAPQIEPSEMSVLAEQGFSTVINNRPDVEIPPPLHAEQMRAAAEAVGLRYVENPADTRSMSLETVRAQLAAIDASPGPVLAYCASGTRSTILWALSMAGRMPTDEIIDAAATGGYDLAPFRGQIDGLAATRDL